MLSEESLVDLNLSFKGITKAQAITLVKMAKIMEWCGRVGTSRNVTFFADGDGNFRPKVSYEASKDISYTEKLAMDLEIWEAQDDHKDFKLDFDSVAWQVDNDTKCGLKPDSELKWDSMKKNHDILF